MPRLFIYIICFLSAFTASNFCYIHYAHAQGAVIFDDDFSQDEDGKFPSHWRISDVDSDFYHGAFRQKNKRMFLVEKHNDGACASVLPLAQPMLEPDINTANYAGDGFKAEFDFFLSTERAAANVYFIGTDHKTNYASICEITGDGALYSQGWNPNYFTHYIQYPSKMDLTVWHHLEAYYNNGEINCYVDDYLLSTTTNCKYTPVSIITMPRGPVKLRRVRLTNGKFAKDEVSKPFTPRVAETKLFKQLPVEKKPALAEKRPAPGNETRLFNQLPPEPKLIAEKKPAPSSNETRLFNKLPEEPQPQPVRKKMVSESNETTLFNKLPDEDKPITQLNTDRKFVSHSIHFNVNEMAIMPQSMPFVHQLAQFLKENPNMKLEIDGHTDSDGGDVYNLNLSQARADEVKRQLIASGIPAKRLTTKGFGAAKPIKPNTTAAGKAENRRVEFIKQE